VYRPDTQKWVASVYRLAKALHPTRLVADNSVSREEGHTQTDNNSRHAYLPGWGWDARPRRGPNRPPPAPAPHIGTRHQAGPPARHQQRVRQRVGLRGLDRRRGLELGLPPRRELLPPPSEDRGLALHRAPRRHQRVERVLAFRPHPQGYGPRGARPGDD